MDTSISCDGFALDEQVLRDSTEEMPNYSFMSSLYAFYLKLLRVGQSASDELFFELSDRVLFCTHLLDFFSGPEITFSRNISYSGRQLPNSSGDSQLTCSWCRDPTWSVRDSGTW